MNPELEGGADWDSGDAFEQEGLLRDQNLPYITIFPSEPSDPPNMLTYQDWCANPVPHRGDDGEFYQDLLSLTHPEWDEEMIGQEVQRLVNRNKRAEKIMDEFNKAGDRLYEHLRNTHPLRFTKNLTEEERGG